MDLKEFGSIPTELAYKTKEKTYPEAERGVNVSLKQLNESCKADTEILFGDITVGQLKLVLESASNFIDFTKFEFGNDWGR